MAITGKVEENKSYNEVLIYVLMLLHNVTAVEKIKNL